MWQSLVGIVSRTRSTGLRLVDWYGGDLVLSSIVSCGACDCNCSPGNGWWNNDPSNCCLQKRHTVSFYEHTRLIPVSSDLWESCIQVTTSGPGFKQIVIEVLWYFLTLVKPVAQSRYQICNILFHPGFHKMQLYCWSTIQKSDCFL